MPDTSPLPTAPGADDFRALARSSPWRFERLHFTHREPGVEPVEAWLQRPGHLEVLDRGERFVETGVPYSRAVLTSVEEPGPLGRWIRRLIAGAKPGLAPQGVASNSDDEEQVDSALSPQSVKPVRRPDGLVLERPADVSIDYDDPMWQNYRWVAMLDPVELTHGVEVSDVQARERLGRLTWTASCRALEGYDPRCSCCPLLFGVVSQALEAEAGGFSGWQDEAAGYPTAYWVSLDVETGIVVDMEPQDGDRANTAFTNEIHDVEPRHSPRRIRGMSDGTPSAGQFRSG